MKNIAFVYSGTSDGLKSLTPNCEAVCAIFKTSKLWEEPIGCKELKSLHQFTKDLESCKDDDIDNLLFFYTGHGRKKGFKRDELHCKLPDDKTRNIQEIVAEIFEVLKDARLLPKRVSIVLDACYSGTLIESNNPFTGSFEILTATSSTEKATESNANSSLSLFTDVFCQTIEALSKGFKEVTLEEIATHIQGGDYTKESGYSYPRTKNGKMIIVEHSGLSLLNDLTSALKNHFENVLDNSSLLEIYAKNLLDFSSKTLPSDFEEIVKYLYEKHKQVLIVLLFKLDDSTLDSYLDDLLDQLRKKRSDIENFSAMKLDMTHERSNLLVTLKVNGKESLGDVDVQVVEYKQGSAKFKNSFRVNLITKSGKAEFIDKLRSFIYLTRTNVLVEYIVPYRLLEEDMLSWKGSDGKALTAKVIRRLSKRIETVRCKSNIEADWKEVWKFYHNYSDKSLSEVKTKEIEFDDLEETPYIRLDNYITEKNYDDFIWESGCIILAPLKNKTKENLNAVCQDLQKVELRKFLITSMIEFKKAKIPYVLIWDNPHRLPLRESEIKNNQYKSALGA